jgi:type II secretory pathway component PulF
MARAGLPLDQGLAALAREMGRGRLREVTRALADDMRAGHTLPEALARQGKRVPAFYAGLVSAGARTGRISEVLATLTTYARTLANLRSIVVDALFYPAVVLVFAFLLFGFMCNFILPQFEAIFRDFNMRLPAITAFVFRVGQHPVAAIVVPIMGVGLGLMLLNLALGYMGGGRAEWAQFLYAFPVFGTLIRSARVAAFTELLAIMVEYELPLPEAFRLAGEASSEPIIGAAAQKVAYDLSQGQPLGQVLRGRGLVPEWVSWMTGVGEQRGTLARTLHQVADMYRRQVEIRASFLRSVLPPFLIICVAGFFVATFAFALMLPMVKLIEGLSK